METRDKEKTKLETSISLRELIKLTDLAEVISEHTKITKKGKQILALCPFHPDTKPSLQINTSKQLYYCFPCQSGGNVVNFLAKINSWDLSEIRRHLAKRANVELKLEKSAFVKEALSYTPAQQQTVEFNKKIGRYFEQRLAQNLHTNLALKTFLDKRGLDIKTIQHFSLGFAQPQNLEELFENNLTKKELITFGFLNSKDELHFQNRVLFPIHNHWGDIVAFSGRSIADHEEPKYLNSPENAVFQKSQLLFNFNRCLDFGQKPKTIFLVEGILDVISLWKSGFEKSVGLLGASLSKTQAALLQDIEVILALDSDEAGMRATLKTIKLLLEQNIEVKILKPFEEVKDIDEFARVKGYEKLKIYIQKNTMTLADYLGFVFGQISPKSSSELLLITSNLSLFIPYLKHVEIEWITNNLAKIYNIGPKTLLDTLYMPHQNLQNIEVNNLKFLSSPLPQSRLRRRANSQRQSWTKKVNIKEIVNPQSKAIWNNKREIYELKILKALIESEELREYFNKKFFESQNYFLSPLHNQFLRVQNQIFETHQTDEWSEDFSQLEIKIHNITSYPKSIDQLNECILNTDNPNVKRLNLIRQINDEENI